MNQYAEKVKEIVQQAENELCVLIGRKVKLELLPIEDITVNEVERLREIIVESSGVSWEKIQAKRGIQEICIARHFYCYFSKTYFNVNLKTIGRSINRDHTTVIHSIQTIKDMLDTRDPEYMEMHEKIIGRMNRGVIPLNTILNVA